ncbi:MAG: hypothetical protein V2A74_04845, partial [bacterium]
MPRKGYKECPACAEWIREKARICRFCGAVLSSEPIPGFVDGVPPRLTEEVEKSVEQKFAKLGVGLSENQRQRLVDFLLKSGEEYRTASVMFMD